MKNNNSNSDQFTNRNILQRNKDLLITLTITGTCFLVGKYVQPLYGTVMFGLYGICLSATPEGVKQKRNEPGSNLTDAQKEYYEYAALNIRDEIN